MKASLAVLLDGLIDYAGLFPPAGLGMAVAMRNYAVYRAGEHARWLGRFVIPVARLPEFEAAAAAEDYPVANGPWPLSALASPRSEDLEAVAAFNARHAGGAFPAVIDTLEIKIEGEAAIGPARERIPAGLMAYFEIPIQQNPSPWIAAIARAGARAKVRTGGVTPDLIPPPAQLTRFIAECARTGVAFKATAGLHHPIRSLRKLTYEAEAPQAVMHGFLNVFLASAFARHGVPFQELIWQIEEQNSHAFAFDDLGVSWGARRLDLAKLHETRERFALAFGSCSFEEPLEDLRDMGLLE